MQQISHSYKINLVVAVHHPGPGRWQWTFYLYPGGQGVLCYMPAPATAVLMGGIKSPFFLYLPRISYNTKPNPGENISAGFQKHLYFLLSNDPPLTEFPCQLGNRVAHIWNNQPGDSRGIPLVCFVSWLRLFQLHSGNRQAVWKVQNLMALGQKVGTVVWILTVYTHLIPFRGL